MTDFSMSMFLLLLSAGAAPTLTLRICGYSFAWYKSSAIYREMGGGWPSTISILCCQEGDLLYYHLSHLEPHELRATRGSQVRLMCCPEESQDKNQGNL